MIQEFIDFCEQLFPSINPYVAEEAKKAMSQFDDIHERVLVEERDDFDVLQGDIFSEIPFIYIDDNGEVQNIICKAQLLSNTCDATRDDKLIFAAIHSLDEFKENRQMVEAIRKNKRYSMFYLPDRITSNYVVDFELLTTFSRKMFKELNEKGMVKRIATLTSVGYYMLLCKLTVFFMRPEDAETNANRI